MALAERIGGEIVGCDAVQVYRGFDAATAKPSADARRRVRHHLVDIADPRRDYSLADYLRDADAAIAEVASRGAAPIVVGGTGLYLRGLLKGVVEAPARDPALRDRLRAMIGRFGAPRLHRWLARLDPGSSARLERGDAQRIVRALEIAIRGEPWSRRLAREGTWRAEEERYDTIKFGLDLERDALRRRLAERVDAFFAAGLVDEVRRLTAEGVPPGANAFKAIGYREVLAALAEGRDPRSERDAIVLATARYAKRQRTWFRGEPAITWLDASVPASELARRVADAWRAPGSRRPAP